MDVAAIYALKPGPNSIFIHNAKQLDMPQISRVVEACKNSESWHKFVIGNVKAYSKEVILKTIIDFVHPLDFFPVYFRKERQAVFLARNCLEAIIKIISNKLLIPNPLDPAVPIRVAIVINQVADNIVNVDLSSNIIVILRKRYNRSKKMLDLSKFHADPDLKEFCMLSQPKMMVYILQLARQMLAEFKPVNLKLILNDNYITALDPLQQLAEFKITRLDLINNELATMEALEPLKSFCSEVINIKLDGNPLCSLYISSEYISKIKQIFPRVVTIDGVETLHQNGLIKVKKNFLCDFSGGDLVNQFVEHFFTLYDSEDRTPLVDLYHPNAMFSVTASLIAMQKTFHTARLSHYLNISRNLRSPTRYFDRKDKFLYQGSENIINLFKELPRTVHDTLQFQCELVCYTQIQAILVVYGVFQEGSEKLGFTRTFVLQYDNEYNAYNIVNDQLHVYNALNMQIRTYFKFIPDIKYSRLPLPYYNRQFWELREAVRSITELNYDYSQRFLETYNYDLKSVLCNFVKLHMSNEIPPEAFIEPRKTPMLDPLDKKKPPLPQDVVTRSALKFEFVTLNTAWMAIHEERLLATMKVTDPSSQILHVLHRPREDEPPPRGEEIIEVSDDDTEDIAEQTAPSTKNQIIDNEKPDTSQGNAGAGNVLPVTYTPAGAQIKPFLSKKQRKKQRAMMRNMGNVPPQSVGAAPATPIPGVQMFTNPQNLGMGTSKAVPQATGQSIPAGAGVNTPTTGKKKNKKKGKTNPNTFNINVFKQECFFTQSKS